VVVYCGGDDLLALLPLHRLLPCLRDLRRLYGGLPLSADSPAGKQGYESRLGFVRRGGRLWRVMGERATCSMGVAVVHQKWPLRHALETARGMERYAKDGLDRNAVAIAVLKRSGGYDHFGARWGVKWTVTDPDPLEALQRVTDLISEGALGRRFTYALQAEVPVLWGLPGALEERAFWLLQRHWHRSRQQGGGEDSFNRERALEVARSLAELAAALACEEERVQEQAGKRMVHTQADPGPDRRFSAGLGLAEFLARDIRGGAG
jgi:CRISPR-associated protein Cmr2